MSDLREFGVAMALGPLTFAHGVPEYGPMQPATMAILGGIVGTVLWVLAAKLLLTVIL